MLQELKELYANRDLKKVRSLVDAYFADDCVVFGTCVGEMGKSKQDVFDLIDSDLLLGEEDIENNYLEEQKEYENSSPLIKEYLANVGFVHSFHNVHGDLFYGVGEKKEIRSKEERIHGVLSQLDNNDLGSYEKLFNLRRDLAYIEKVYANDEYPSVIMKYFGLIKDNKVVFVQYTYPHFYYLEEKYSPKS